MRDGGEIHLCPKCEGAGEEYWTDSVDMESGYSACEKCEGSGLILRITTHRDQPWLAGRNTKRSGGSE